MYKQLHFILTCAAALMSSACEQPETCPDCEEEDEIEVPARLPCDGADLQNDDLNCGSCGKECIVEDVGTPYEAGNCNDGQCGPRWLPKYFEDTVEADSAPPPELTCDEVCAEYETTCIAQGCSGKTGYTCMTLFGNGCSLVEPHFYPYDFTGSCTEVLPWSELEVGYKLQAGCCCASTQ